MSNNDGAAMAQCIAVGEELSRAMVEVAHLRAENARLREALEDASDYFYDCWLYDAWATARAALKEKE